MTNLNKDEIVRLIMITKVKNTLITEDTCTISIKLYEVDDNVMDVLAQDLQTYKHKFIGRES